MKNLIISIVVIFFFIFSGFAQWQESNDGLYGGGIYAIAVDPITGYLFAGTDSGVFLTTDNGNNWTAINSGLTNPYISSLAISGNNIYAGTNDGVFLSTNNGNSWIAINNGLTNPYILSLAISGNNIYAGTLGGGVFLSTNYGNSWTAINSGLTNLFVYSLVINENNIYAGTNGGVFLSTNNGNSWTAKNNGLPSNAGNAILVRSLAVNGNNIFAGTLGYGLYLSTDNGENWNAINSGLPPINSILISTIKVNGSSVFAGTSSGLFVSTDNGNSWNLILSQNIFSFLIHESNFFAGTRLGVFLSTNNGVNWNPVNYGIKSVLVTSLAASGGKIFAGSFYGVFLSVDNGSNWIAVNNGLTNLSINSVAISGNYIYAGTNDGVFLSTNNGNSWSAINNGLTNLSINSLAIKENNLYAGTNGGVFISVDNGNSWSAMNNGLTNIYGNVPSVISLFTSGSNVYAGTGGSGSIFFSSDSGNSWTELNNGLPISPTFKVTSIEVKENFIFLGTSIGVYVSTNNGSSWTEANNGLSNEGSAYINSLKFYGNNIFAGTNNGVFISSDNGENWTSINNGLVQNYDRIRDVEIMDDNIFVGTINGVWRRIISEIFIEPQDFEALIALYNATDGNNWTNNLNWLSNENFTNWHGVSVVGNRVVSINLENNNLSGTLPLEIENLTEIETLNLSKNSISGSVPESIGVFHKLSLLSLNNNLLSGSVPNSLSNLTQLQSLNLSNNKFTALPAFTLNELDSLWVQNNRLTFEDIEPNINVPNKFILYFPQDSIGVSQGFMGCLNSDISLSVNLSGANNIYQWYKGSTLIPNANEPTLVISEIQSTDTGSYICSITNSIVPDLTLFSKAQTVSLHPSPSSFSITGKNSVSPFEIALYSAPNNGSVTYQWSAENGNILTYPNANSVEIHWGNSGIGYVYGYSTNQYECISERMELRVDIGSTGIENNNLKDKVSIYPNPAKDYVVIGTGGHFSLHGYIIKIVNMSGLIVYESVIHNSPHKINLSEWKGKGLFLIRIFDGSNKEVTSKKIMIL